MLDTVFAQLLDGKFSGQIRKKSSQNFVNGRATTTFDSVEDVEFFTIPDSINEKKIKENLGSQIIDNRHFYFDEENYDIQNGDEIIFENSVYEIRGVESRPHGNFTYAFGKYINRLDNSSGS